MLNYPAAWVESQDLSKTCWDSRDVSRDGPGAVLSDTVMTFSLVYSALTIPARFSHNGVTSFMVSL